MKKSKILIPALSVASVGAVVAPMVTSCTTTNGMSFAFKTNDEYAKERTALTPFKQTGTFAKPDKNYAIFTEAGVQYGAEVAKNPNVLADDILNAIFKIQTQVFEKATNANVTVSDISVNTQIIELASKTYAIPTYSFTVSYVTSSVETESKGTERYDLESSMKFVNVPAVVHYETGDSPVIMFMDTTLDPTKTEGLEELAIWFTTLHTFGGHFEFNLKDWDSEEGVYNDAHFTIDNLGSYLQVLGIAGDYLTNFLEPVQSNYFSNTTEEQ